MGRVTYGKGIDLLFKALPYVTVPYRLRLVGDGNSDEIEELDKLAKSLKIDKHIEFCGFTQGETLVKEYKKASVFVLPTREDCYGLVLLEALCALKPIVVSKYADGAYDMVINDQNGVIVDPYNAEQLGKAIEKILIDECWQYKSMKVNLELRDKFSFDAVTKGYLEAIRYVANS